MMHLDNGFYKITLTADSHFDLEKDHPEYQYVLNPDNYQPDENYVVCRIEVTSQNHSYAVDAESLFGTPLQVTHINLLDQTVEGIACEKDRAFSVQYHPESAPGPEDSGYLFDQFIERL